MCCLKIFFLPFKVMDMEVFAFSEYFLLFLFHGNFLQVEPKSISLKRNFERFHNEGNQQKTSVGRHQVLFSQKQNLCWCCDVYCCLPWVTLVSYLCQCIFISLFQESDQFDTRAYICCAYSGTSKLAYAAARRSTIIIIKKEEKNTSVPEIEPARDLCNMGQRSE